MTDALWRRAVFLDKDGTIVVDVPFNVTPSLIRLTRNAAAGLRLLHEAGFLLIVVSNQPGVALGHFAEPALEAVQQRLDELFRIAGSRLDGFYYCPHHPAGVVDGYSVDCTCRKPAPGLLLRAAREHRVDLDRSWLIGDILDDIEAGRRAGCRTALLDVGNETEWLLTPERRPHCVTTDLLAAARGIVRSTRPARAPVARGAVG